jgi:hypothetical protein
MPTKIVGLELSYVSRPTGVKDPAVGDADTGVTRNGGSIRRARQPPAHRAVAHHLRRRRHQQGSVSDEIAGYRDDTFGNDPLGAGVDWRIGNFMAGARFTFNYLFDREFTPATRNGAFGFSDKQGGDIYNGQIQLGGIFSRPGSAIRSDAPVASGRTDRQERGGPRPGHRRRGPPRSRGQDAQGGRGGRDGGVALDSGAGRRRGGDGAGAAGGARAEGALGGHHRRRPGAYPARSARPRKLGGVWGVRAERVLLPGLQVGLAYVGGAHQVGPRHRPGPARAAA